VTDYTAEIAAAMSQGMDGENRRRELASQMPGHGALVQLPPTPNGPGGRPHRRAAAGDR
jgi:hypothetical protein